MDTLSGRPQKPLLLKASVVILHTTVVSQAKTVVPMTVLLVTFAPKSRPASRASSPPPLPCPLTEYNRINYLVAAEEHTPRISANPQTQSLLYCGMEASVSSTDGIVQLVWFLSKTGLIHGPTIESGRLLGVLPG